MNSNIDGHNKILVAFSVAWNDRGLAEVMALTIPVEIGFFSWQKKYNFQEKIYISSK